MTDISVRLLSGTVGLLRAQQAELPQKDGLCGAFWGLAVLRAFGYGEGGTGDRPDPLDQDIVALRSGTTVGPADSPAPRPPGEPARLDYRLALPQAANPSCAGASPSGLGRAVEELSGGGLAVVPLLTQWEPERLSQLLDHLVTRSGDIACLANLTTAHLWGAATPRWQLLSYLVDGDQTAVLPADWSVGHFVALLGLVDGPLGQLALVADSYPSLGDHAVHLQPVDRLAAALRLHRTGGGLLVVVSADVRDDLVSSLVDAGFEVAFWDNGSIDPRVTCTRGRTRKYRPMSGPTDRALPETIELLQALIRNACVNDGSPGSGEEWRSADVLESFLEGSDLDLERYEPTPGRASLVARLEGSDPNAPTLCLMGHTDVVPVSAAAWSHDPFGGELIDGEIWGRGAVDMLNLTASMAVAVRQLASSGWRPRGTVIYLAVADEEAGGVHGAEWLSVHARDAIACDLVVTESGGWTVPGRGGPKVVVTVGEKGVAWRRLRVRGTPGHGSTPYGADNAVVKAAEVIRRISAYEPRARISESWRRYLGGLNLPDDVRDGLLDPDRFAEACAALPDQRFASYAHASTHTTLSPNMVHGGSKTNIIPDEVVIELDARILPGDEVGVVDELLTEVLGPLGAEVVVEPITEREGSESPFDTRFMDALSRVVHLVYPEATLLPRVASGATDAPFFREIGAVAYGFGLLSRSITAEDFSARFHGNDERIDIDSLRLTTEGWLALCEDLSGP